MTGGGSGVVSETIFYGEGPSQFGDLVIPARAVPMPVVLVHGGFWRAAYGLDLMEPLAADLNDRGHATWNIEYRRVGEPGGGYPNTLLDVAAAIDQLAAVDHAARLDLDRVAVIGHSAGGHLALWSASRGTIAAPGPGADPLVTPRLAVGLAPVVDLAEAASANLGSGAVRELLGGDPDEVPERYVVAQPDLVDGCERSVIVHGDADLNVPVSQARLAEDAGVEVVVIPRADHFDVIDPSHESWMAVIATLASL